MIVFESYRSDTTHAVKREWRKVRGMPWKAVTLDVELDLSEKDEKKPRWQPVRLLFVRGLKEPSEAQVDKKDWALFLTTDIQLSMSKILETYALRWGIEVYFKETKQHRNYSAKKLKKVLDKILLYFFRFQKKTAYLHQ
ncbi:MAG: hypothetical protein KZQ71_11655 [Candidatus Thiodiazotropha sp. (ex Lucinoma aequizonata)]|nr:hypothetical protein [Candidatus Thiodiazotropha sp. (ex Lucinoma aequizonata)]